MNRAQAVKDKLTKIQAENSLALVSKGGRLFGTMRRPTSDEAAKHKFKVFVFDRDGNEIKTAPRQFNSEIMKGPDGLWQRYVAVDLLSPLQLGDSIHFVDQLDGRHRKFTVKAKAPSPSQPAKP